MKKIHIMTDCTSDLSAALIKENSLIVLPLYINFEDKSYRDGIDITTEEMYQRIEETGKLPKTSALSPGSFIEEFSKIPSEDDIIFMGIGSGFSATYNNARLAAEDFPNAHIVDSQNLSSGIGVMLLKMCALRSQGKETKEIIAEIEKMRPLVRTQFAINTLEYLHMGGRCSGTSRIFGTLLKIKPIIRVIDGAMVVAKKPRGKYKVALDTLLAYVEVDKDNIDLDYVMITHSLASEEAKYLRFKLESMLPIKNLIETKASGVISTHCGPRTIGILYVLKK